MKTLSQIAIATTFEDVRETIESMAASFSRMKGGDVDDLIGDACVAFMQAYNSYDPSKGDFDKWLRLNMRRTFIDAAAKIAYRAHLLRRVGAQVLEEVANRREWSLTRFLDELSLDGLEAVEAAFEAHVDGLTGVALKAHVRHRLVDLEWDGERIKKAFDEVRTALED
jgi:DNA-directed RNA polymerase specialized sigma24 family protein